MNRARVGRRLLPQRLVPQRLVPQRVLPRGVLPRRQLPERLRDRLGPAFVVLSVVVGACSPSVSPTSGSPAGGLESPGSTRQLPSGSPSASAVAPSSTSTTGKETPIPSDSTSPSGPLPSGGAARCSGSDANRTFYLHAAQGVAWAVYCPVLPDHWYIETGTYQLAGGGILEATYRGPGDAQLSIVEGNVCADFGTNVDLCVPRDLVIGPALMGDMTGALGRLGSGLVLDIDRGANPSWRVTGLSLSQADFEAIAAAFARVGG